MDMFCRSKKGYRFARGGFSVTEVLVAVAIMTLIVFILYQVFDQTQQALRANATQVDVLEGGRAAMDLVGGELEQLQSGYVAGGTNFYVSLNDVAVPAALPPVVQPMPGGSEERTNILQNLFFLRRDNRDWVGTGYCVLSVRTNGVPSAPVSTNGFGSLFRFTFRVNHFQLTSNNLINAFFDAIKTAGGSTAQNQGGPANQPGASSLTLQRVTDGVIHFRAIPADSEGYDMHYTYATGNYDRMETGGGGRPVKRIWLNAPTNGPANIFLRQELYNQTEAAFTSNAIPAHIDLEMAILEPETVEQVRSIPRADAARDFLENRINKVHLFRKRIPIRSAEAP